MPVGMHIKRRLAPCAWAPAWDGMHIIVSCIILEVISSLYHTAESFREAHFLGFRRKSTNSETCKTSRLHRCNGHGHMHQQKLNPQTSKDRSSMKMNLPPPKLYGITDVLHALSLQSSIVI